MSESLLKKEFKVRDVERMRNLIKGKHGDKTVVGIGYSKTEEFHKEGDIWDEDGRQWTIKNGIKQNITKLDKAKSSLSLPLFCPSCKNIMNHKYDKLFYIQYHRCFDCQLNFEAEIKLLGLWDEYEKNIINSEIESTIQDFKIWMDEEIGVSNNSFVTENGDVENWVGTSKKHLLQSKDETIKFLQSLKKN